MEQKKLAIIATKGTLDWAYPPFILASTAAALGYQTQVFFTFYGLNAITDDKVDHLHVNLAGNAATPIPTLVAGLPGMESLAAKMMSKKM